MSPNNMNKYWEMPFIFKINNGIKIFNELSFNKLEQNQFSQIKC